jgi:ATP-dependent Lon protease
MSIDEISFSLDQFSGTARLFPLPNLVVFPHVMQPLHIFEPRYRAMLEEALADDKLIAMSILSPGWESNYDGRPPVQSTACLCRVATHQTTELGTYNVLLVGLRRITIMRELEPRKLFREADVQVVEDVYPAENADRRGDLQRRLVSRFRRALPKLAGAQEQIEELLTAQISLGMLTDIIAYTLQLDQKIKEDLLAHPLPDLRALLLLECLNSGAGAAPGYMKPCDKFPPEFSLN